VNGGAITEIVRECFTVLEVGTMKKPKSPQEEITCKEHGRDFIPNLLNTCDPGTINFKIDKKFKLLEAKVFNEDYLHNKTFSKLTLRSWHRFIFKEIYKWAGQYRSINLEKHPYACNPNFIIKNMQSLDLEKYTPCNIKDPRQLVNVLSSIYSNFIIYHPFRDGNARLAKLLIKCIAFQAGYKELSFKAFNRNGHVEKILIEHSRNECCKPLASLMERVLLSEFDKYCKANDVISIHRSKYF
jgi:cell filamentation protein